MQKLMVKTGSKYRAATPGEVAEANAAYVQVETTRERPNLSQPALAVQFLRPMIGALEHEVFVVVLLDNRHRLIVAETLFRGTIDGANVYPREVVKFVLRNNAAAVIFAHNHPSGVAEPSQADELITRRLVDALALIDVRVLDHIIIGLNSHCSFAERGLI